MLLKRADLALAALNQAELDAAELETSEFDLVEFAQAETKPAKLAPEKTALVNTAPAEMTLADIDRVIEMAWEDRTPFEAIELQFGLNQDGVIKLMRSQLKAGSFKLWRARTRGQKTKHLKLRSADVVRHQSREHNKLNRV